MEVEQQAPSQSLDFYHVASWLHKNQKRLIVAAAIVFGIGAVIAIVIWHNNKQDADANDALFAMPSTFGAGAAYAHPNADALQKLAQEYPNTPAGENAELLAASVMFTDGRYAESEKAFGKFLNDHPSSALDSQAAIGVAASLEAQGKTSDAIAKYQDVIGKYPSENSIVSPAKLTLARLFEEQNKPSDALRYYDELSRITAPYDPWAGEAKERKEQLLTKHPELRPAPAATTPMSTPTLKQSAPSGGNGVKMLQVPSSAPAKK
jgi:predicted negative regulator of RcsB-dependent stress response